MTDLTLYGHPASTFNRTARMVCEEKGVHYQLEPAALQSEAYHFLHPFRKMPAMRHGDVVLYETLAIATYLDERFPGPTLQPADNTVRAHMLQWISAFNDYVCGDLVRGVLNGASRDPREALDRSRSHLGVIDRALEPGPFLLGESVTLADLFLAPMLAYAETNEQTAGLIDEFPRLAAWRQRVGERPSFRHTEPNNT